MRSIVVLLAVLALLNGAAAVIKSCKTADCSANCTTADVGANTCVATSGTSSEYTCKNDQVTVKSWANTDCSGTPASSTLIGKANVCNDGPGVYLYASCTSTPAPKSGAGGFAHQLVVVAVASILAALLVL